MLFTNKQEKKQIVEQFFCPPPPPKEVAKIQVMLRQVEKWINVGEKELAEKHWNLISEECRKYGT